MLVAGVDAGGAADALHLEAVADIDTGGADLDAAVAVDAVAGGGVGGFAPGFAACFVVADDDGIVVGEGGLDAAVGAEDDAELFAEPGEGEVEGAGEEEDDAEGDVRGRGGLRRCICPERGEGDEVGEEDVGDGGGGDEVEGVFEDAFGDFWNGPWGGVELAAGGGIAVDEAFDAAEDVLEEDGVGAGPAAPEAAEEGGDEEEGEAEAGEEEEAEPEILGDEGDAEEVEAAVVDVEEDGGVAVDGDPGEGDVDGDEEEAEDGAPAGEGAGHRRGGGRGGSRPH